MLDLGPIHTGVSSFTDALNIFQSFNKLPSPQEVWVTSVKLFLYMFWKEPVSMEDEF